MRWDRTVLIVSPTERRRMLRAAYLGRVKRRVLVVAAALSLVLCLVVLFFWLSSYLQGWQAEWLRAHADGRGWSSCEIQVSGGGIELSARSLSDISSASASQTRGPISSRVIWKRQWTNDYPRLLRAVWGFLWWDTSNDGQSVHVTREVVLPCALVFLLTAALPVIWLIRWKRASRPPGGLDGKTALESATCGTVSDAVTQHDSHGTPEQKTDPE